jgi:hypothetical protein
MTATPTKVTFSEMRASGVHEVLIYCRDHRCSAEVRPAFRPARMGTR